MANEEKAKRSDESGSRRFPVEGKAARVLSTSLGVALLANAFLIPGATAAGASANTSGDQTAADEPILVSWSTEEVKQYFDKNTDWNIPLKEQPEEDQEGQSASTGSGSSGGGTTVINNYGSAHSGFGWDDLLLYHMLFNSGSSYSTTNYYNGRPTYYTGTSQTYKPRTYTSGTFQNKPVVGSTVRPKTSTSTGSITRRGTSSSSGSIGGKSSGFSSSSSSHSSSRSGGFGG